MLFYILSLLFYSLNIFPQWIQINNSGIDFVNCFTASSGNIFAGTDSGVFISTNNGINWAQVNNGLPNTTVFSLTKSVTDIFAGTEGGIYLSTNDGENWTLKNNGVTINPVLSLTVKDTNIFAGTFGGVFLSTNKGTNWTKVNNGLIPSYIWSLTVVGSNILAGTMGYGVFLSTNNGANWAQYGLATSYVRSLIISGSDIFAGTIGHGIFLSTNNGAAWNSVNYGLTSSNIYSFAINGNNIFAASDSGTVYFSSNNGTNWVQVGNGLPYNTVWSLVISGNNILAATDGSGIWIRSLSEFIVPVELISFTADFRENIINLNWKTATEVNNLGFNVERSINKSDWMKMAFICGNQNSTSIIAYSYVDKSLSKAGKYYYRLKQIDNDGSYKYSNIIEADIISPSQFTLAQNYPNPFNPSTKINYTLSDEAKVVLELYNITGERIGQLVNEEQSAGYYSIEINLFSFNKHLSSGIYFYRMNTIKKIDGTSFTSIKKMVLLK